jgi:hypothetical protein
MGLNTGGLIDHVGQWLDVPMSQLMGKMDRLVIYVIFMMLPKGKGQIYVVSRCWCGISISPTWGYVLFFVHRCVIFLPEKGCKMVQHGDVRS